MTETFTTRFCNIIKQQICTTTAELDFDNFTTEGTYEIYEDLGNGQTRVYFLTVDKSASGSCVSQTRLHCGKMEYRYFTEGGKWSNWQNSGGSGGGSEAGGYYTPSISQTDETTAVISFTPSAEGMPAVDDTELTLPKGDPGYTPVRGTDYWTENDKAEIKAYVDDAILGGAW